MNYPVRGKARIHRLRAERALGRPLPIGAIVHHADGTMHADAPLVICQDHPYHLLLHVRMRVINAGGNPNIHAVCGHCGLPKAFAEFAPTPARSTGRSHICHSCDALKAKARRRRCGPIISAKRRARWLERKAAVNASRRLRRAQQQAAAQAQPDAGAGA